jgi:hypothetical protein
VSKRDNFNKPIRELLARRVGFRCSNPNCRILTIGPGDSPTGTTDVGIAAHIAAAAPGGKRYDPSMTHEERGSYENGIWLCQIHAKLVDDARERFPSDLLKQWKRLSEDAARLEIVELEKDFQRKHFEDIDAIQTLAIAFDRNAFTDSFRNEMSMSAFDQAIRDVVIALATGIVRDRKGNVVKETRGRSQFHTREWREKLGIVITLLNAILARFELAVSSKSITIHNRGHATETYCINDHALIDWMDSTRSEALGIFGNLLAEAGLDPLPQQGFVNRRRW